MSKSWDEMTTGEKADELLRRLEALARLQNSVNENVHQRLKVLEAAAGVVASNDP